MSVFVGLDLSLQSTGFCLKDGEKVVLETIKTVPKNFDNDLQRLIHIRDVILEKIPDDVAMICIEDFFVPMSRTQMGASINLTMLGTAVRLALYEKGLPFTVISPSQVKKFATGKGTGQKSLVVLHVFQRWGYNCSDDNQADAASLCHIAESLRTVQDDRPEFQKEVIMAVLKDRPTYLGRASRWLDEQK